MCNYFFYVMKSSSFININGDIKQSKFSILMYLFFNIIQNIYYSLFTVKFRYLTFNPKNKDYKFRNDQSLSRKLCGVFWKNINWKVLHDHIGKFNICEIGTGDGNYFKTDILIKKKYIERYRGFDVIFNNNWKKLQNKTFLYKKFDGVNFKKITNKNNNLFLSQSCLEHVMYDLKYFDEVINISKKSKKKSIMIHCLPSSFCLFTYLTHGFRQYNVENLNKISKIIGYDNSFVIKLGNFELNLEHLKKTTLPLIFKNQNLMKKQSKIYYKKINSKIIYNRKSSLFTSSFVVFVGLLNFSRKEKETVIKKLFY